eukprot:SAG22_NODE_3341_length_1769_cov_1.831138_2_plen_310_part_00
MWRAETRVVLGGSPSPARGQMESPGRAGSAGRGGAMRHLASDVVLFESPRGFRARMSRPVPSANSCQSCGAEIVRSLAIWERCCWCFAGQESSSWPGRPVAGAVQPADRLAVALSVGFAVTIGLLGFVAEDLATAGGTVVVLMAVAGSLQQSSLRLGSHAHARHIAHVLRLATVGCGAVLLWQQWPLLQHGVPVISARSWLNTGAAAAGLATFAVGMWAALAHSPVGQRTLPLRPACCHCSLPCITTFPVVLCVSPLACWLQTGRRRKAWLRLAAALAAGLCLVAVCCSSSFERNAEAGRLAAVSGHRR